MAVQNNNDVIPTMRSVVEYTRLGFSPSLFMKRKKVVSMPYVSTMISSAV